MKIASMKKSAGFTLVELLVTLSIAAILVALAAPSFTRTIRSVNMSSAVNTFIADASYARSEGVRRGGHVVMCRSDNSQSNTPDCATSGANWESGWIIFYDSDNSNSVTGDEIPLRRQSPITNVNSITSSGTAKLIFSATGRLDSGTAMSLTFGSLPVYSTVEQRKLCANVGGRVTVAGDGSSTCP